MHFQEPTLIHREQMGRGPFPGGPTRSGGGGDELSATIRNLKPGIAGDDPALLSFLVFH